MAFRQHMQRKPCPHSDLDPTSGHERNTGSSSDAWKRGVQGCAAASIIVLALNASFLTWGLLRHGSDAFMSSSAGSRTFYTGSCNKTRLLNTSIHLIINVLSTIILGASNYCMQCLSAPTREELDKIHRKKRWLDIGVLSVRNLLKTSKRRTLLWLLLGISSVPLHLL
jgi:hypothetical protein